MINAQAIGAIHTHVAVVTARYIILPFLLALLTTAASLAQLPVRLGVDLVPRRLADLALLELLSSSALSVGRMGLVMHWVLPLAWLPKA